MNHINRPSPSVPHPDRVHDPMLQELWDIKAALNKQANYDVSQVLANAAAFAAQFKGADGRVKAQ
jgi:hypothetical protein